MLRDWALLLGLLLTVGPTVAQGQGRPPAPVGVDEVRLEPVAQTVPGLGRFVAPQSGVVAARAAGPVAELKVSVGDHVERGAVLAELNQDRLRAQLALQTAELDALKAARETASAKEKYAANELQRITKLRKSAAFSQYDYDSREQELAVSRSARLEAEARIARGETNRRLAEIELRDGVIKAPYPGVVTLRHTSAGAWLKIGDPVVTLINDGELEIEADVPADRLAALTVGSEIEVALDDGSRFTAAVRAVIPDENPAARTRPVRLVPRFDPDNTTLRPAVNQAVTLQLPVSSASEVVSVAKDAVIRRGREALVFVVEQGTAQPRPVELGHALGSRFQVLGGLQPGDVVVVRGNERLRPGQPVQYPGQPAAPAPAGEQGKS